MCRSEGPPGVLRSVSKEPGVKEVPGAAEQSPGELGCSGSLLWKSLTGTSAAGPLGSSLG